MIFNSTFSAGATVSVWVEDDVWYARCSGCPGWTAAADSWDVLCQLTAENHEGLPHSWTMVSPLIVETEHAAAAETGPQDGLP